MARNPAPEFPVRTYPSPVISEQVVIEFVTSELANSKPIEPGTSHPNQREFAGFKLGIQRVNPQDSYFTQRIWVNDQAPNHEAYNYALKFVSESVAHPIFIRSDRELKTDYTPRAKGSALQSVYKLVVTNPGSGYTPGTEPALTFAGGGGSGASAHAIVAPDGTIAEFVFTSGGIGYTSAPTFTVAAPTSGVTATGTAYIQPTSAVLVAEEAQQFPQESEFYALYFSVLRAYQTLPGPVKLGQDLNRQLGIPLPYTLQDTAAGDHYGEQNVEIIPKDSVQQEVKSSDTSLLLFAFGSYFFSWPDAADIALPAVLQSINSVKNENYAEGGDDGSGAGSVTGDHGSYSLADQRSPQSSASLGYELNIKIKRYEARGKRTARCVFIMRAPFTADDVLTVLSSLIGATVNFWPDFRPVEESLVVKGMSVKVQVEAHTQVHLSFDTTANSSGYTAGTSWSHGTGITGGPTRLPATIHGSISIGGDGTSASRAVAAAARSQITGTVADDSGPVSESATASASISPTSLSATDGTSTVPTSGFYIMPGSTRTEPLQDNYIILHYELFDFGYLEGSTATTVSRVPIFRPAAGSYTIGVSTTVPVLVRSPDPAAVLRYTTDGTTPTAGSSGHGTLINASQGIVRLSPGTTTLKVIAYNGNVVWSSSVTSGVYGITVA